MKIRIAISILLLMLFMSTVIVAAKDDRTIIVEYFYFPRCDCSGYMNEMPDVDQLVLKIKNKYGNQTQIEWIDISTPEGLTLFKQYNITETPTIVINHEFKIPREEITYEKLKEILDKYLKGASLQFEENAESTSSSENKKRSIIIMPLIIMSGLVDGVNPCAFALLIFFLSFL